MRCDGEVISVGAAQDMQRERTHLESENGVDGKIGEVVLVLGQDLRGEGGSGNVDKVGSEGGGIVSASRCGGRRIRSKISGLQLPYSQADSSKERLGEEHAPVVLGSSLESVEGGLAGDSVPLNDGLGVNLHVDESLSLSQQLTRQHANRRRSVSNLVVLDLRDVDEDLGGGVVERNRFEDGRSVVGNNDLSRRSRLCRTTASQSASQ